MLLGIVLHAAVTYMVEPMDGLLWPQREQPTQIGFDMLFWWIHGWRIPLFFVMAGFFAAMLARRRGPGGFIKHRVDRILKPVVVASVTLLPLMYYLWCWGWLVEGRVRWEEVWQFDFDTPQIEEHFMGPAHLWFLNYLMLFSVAYWLILKCRGNTPERSEPLPGKAGAWLFTSAFRPLFFAVPTFLLLLASPDFFLGYHHVIPMSLTQWGYEIAQMIYQGLFFVTGVYLFRLHRDMEAIKKHAWLYLALAQIAFAFCGFMIAGQIGDASDAGSIPGPTFRIGLAVSVALFCWLMIWGLTGIGLTVLAKPRAIVRWLSDSAYWVYLVHLPIVVVVMIAIRNWSIGPWPRFVIVVAVTSLLTMLSYRYLVRYTVIGRWLNGPRARPAGD